MFTPDELKAAAQMQQDIHMHIPPSPPPQPDAGRGALKSCPFCGRDAQPIGIHNDLAHCPNKQCVLYCRKMYRNEWNTRAPAPPGPAAPEWEPY